jgi:competence ComEA-like helix-hairpin-helix protein
MTSSVPFLLGVTAWALVASTLVAARPEAQSQAPASSVTDEEGAMLLSYMCGECHDGERIVEKRRTKADWQDVLHKMIEKGAIGEEKEFERLFAYLCRKHGSIYINGATPDEITMVLGLTRKDADAIIAHRKANGSFADFDALKKVPDIDVTTLETRKESVVF